MTATAGAVLAVNYASKGKAVSLCRGVSVKCGEQERGQRVLQYRERTNGYADAMERELVDAK